MGVTVRCRKYRYRDELSAKMALAKVQWRDSPRRPKAEKRAYYCKTCRAFHLTSLESWNETT